MASVIVGRRVVLSSETPGASPSPARWSEDGEFCVGAGSPVLLDELSDAFAAGDRDAAERLRAGELDGSS